MKRGMFLIISAMIFFLAGSVFVNAQAEQTEIDYTGRAGITPDNPVLWALDRAVERIQLLLTFNQTKKIELRLAIANERLAEISVMIAKNKTDAAEAAEKARGEEIEIIESLGFGNLSKIEIAEKPEEIANAANLTCGYCQHLVNGNCLNYTCCRDEECKVNEYCSEHECVALSCSYCQHMENGNCVDYECCADEDCAIDYECINHICTTKALPEENTINFETLHKTDRYFEEYNGPCTKDDSQIGGYYVCVSITTNNTEWDKIRKGVKAYTLPDFSDFENYLLATVFYTMQYPFVEIKKITQTDKDIKIYFDAWTGGKPIGGGTALHTIKIKKTDLTPKENLNFLFIGNETLGTGVSYNITLGEWKIENINID